MNGDRSNTLSGSYSKMLWSVTIINCWSWLWHEQTSVSTQKELHPCTVDVIVAPDWARLGFTALWWNFSPLVKPALGLGKPVHWLAHWKQLCRVSRQSLIHDGCDAARVVGWREGGKRRDSVDWLVLLGSLSSQCRDTDTARGFGWAAPWSISPHGPWWEARQRKRLTLRR